MVSRNSMVQTGRASTTPAVLVPPSPGRAALLFVAPTGTETVTVNVRPPSAAGDGVVLQAGAGSLQLTREIHGDIVGQAWYARASAGSILTTWIETVGG